MEAINNIRYLSPAVVLSCYVMSNSLWPRGLQHARLPCPSPSPGVCPSSCPLNCWCHPTISSFVTLLSGFVLTPFRAIISLKYHKGITDHRWEKSGSRDNTWPKSAVIVPSRLIFPKTHVTSPECHCFFPYSHYAREIIPNFSVSSYVSWVNWINTSYLQNWWVYYY